ncbi:acyl carrier protein [Streptomonospora sp. S1-112]|uniref:Acyl carrier protein n=1 Tax=Streptomonospora mangrovi TaxID=2883123 RepID=A0A9X3NW38_9ACTN|nr:acyl carrier protein [Streptomonospora mangrovi]MDA0565341.1 acyl carrier protein [Streptomonospora mangrovi]
MTGSTGGTADVRALMIDSVARRTGADPAEVDPRVPFLSLGLSSRDAVSLCGELESRLGRPVPALLPWRYPTIDSLAAHLGDSSDPTPSAPSGTPVEHHTPTETPANTPPRNGAP